jgi:hypothetical protein
VGRELALCYRYKEKRQVYRRRGALGVQEELFKPAGMEAAAATEARQAARAGLIRAYSMVKGDAPQNSIHMKVSWYF